MAQPNLVTLLTDFGLRDPYVAEMKAVILSQASHVTLVDITHHIPKFSIKTGAFILASAAPYFPPNTIHLAVVDPGVGGRRRALAIETQHFKFIGPDNGLLVPAAKMDGPMRAYEITSRKFKRSDLSTTFHGRDIFAVTTALLACGARTEEVGPAVSDLVEAPFAFPEKAEGRVKCEVIHVDDFGNVATSVHKRDLVDWGMEKEGKFRFVIGRKRLTIPFMRTYSDVPRGGLVALVGSHGFLEIGVNQGNAARRLNAALGTRIAVEL